MLKSKLVYLATLAEFARTGPKKPPRRLNAWLRNRGGVKDTGGELTRVLGERGQSMPGLINNRAGLNLDDATHYAWEAGFIPSQDRPHIDQLLDLMECDMSGRAVTSADDAQAAEAYYEAEQARDYLDQLGILGDCPSKQIRVEAALLEHAEAVQ